MVKTNSFTNSWVPLAKNFLIMKKILALMIFLFFINETRSQTQLLDSLPEKMEPKFIFNPKLTFSPFTGILKAKTPQSKWRAIDVGLRSTISIKKPDFIFLYLDIFHDAYREESFVRFGKPDIITEEKFLGEFGVGFLGDFKIWKEFSLYGEITFPFNEPPYPTITTSLMWTSKNDKFFIGAGNLIKTEKQGIFNPLIFVGFNIFKS